MKKDLLIIFVKNPELGKAKTRLAKTVGKKKALQVYELLLSKTKAATQDLRADKIVYYNDFIDSDDLWSQDIYQKDLQPKGDLGEKMIYAFQAAFDKGYQRVCIIGSDCYDLEQSHIEGALNELNTHDAVIGPAKDGGYYLLGMSSFIPSVFENKSWSTSSVASETVADLKRTKRSFFMLPTLSDIDTEEDLGPWAHHIIKE